MDSESQNESVIPTFEQWMAFYNETVRFEQKIGIIIPTIFAIIIIVGVVGNLLVVVVALNRQMRNSTNTLIIGWFIVPCLCHNNFKKSIFLVLIVQ
uniref:G_PROTEIN_RECEP_F1_2 domain-containing protein n=1 Tax=Heterorhabditis bacteriophora TaxID=37862 RepID=A0A1I7XC60_HETBA